MHYLINKTARQITANLSPYVGVVTLEPWQYISVEAERWDTQAFNTLKTLVGMLVLADSVPQKIQMNRKLYLEQHNPEYQAQLQADLETINTAISKEETTLSELQADLDKLKADRDELSNSIESAQKELEANKADGFKDMDKNHRKDLEHLIKEGSKSTVAMEKNIDAITKDIELHTAKREELEKQKITIEAKVQK